MIRKGEKKLRYDLVPYEAIEALAKVLTFGAEKHGANSWQDIEDADDQYYAAAMRHLQEWRKNRNAVDAESGFPALAHALCDIMFLLVKGIREKRGIVKDLIAPKLQGDVKEGECNCNNCEYWDTNSTCRPCVDCEPDTSGGTEFVARVSLKGDRLCADCQYVELNFEDYPCKDCIGGTEFVKGQS
jgi:hypothetical protein